jgi:two-component sensor histidine kinase
VLEGNATVNARSRSEMSGWTAAVAVPQSLLVGQFFGPAALAGLAGSLMSLLALAALGMLASRLVQDIHALSKATEKLSNRDIVATAPMSIKELNIVAHGIEHASERLKAEEQFRKRALDELAHRLRNKVATIQAIIYSRLRDHLEIREEILNRLSALSTTDDLLIKAQGEGANLADILDSELAPYDRSRIAAEGPEVLLEPNLAFTMALLFHELATNAAKYGAFSSAQGRVKICWSVANNRLDLEWRETGGPPVQKPERRGFGTQLVISALAAFGGEARANFEPTGLVVRMQTELAHDHMRVVDQNPLRVRDMAV